MDTRPDSTPAKRLKVGISACLLGIEVRYNGGHKESRLCSQSLAGYFDFIPLCPEVAIGLGIPRATIRLVGDPAAPQAEGGRMPSGEMSEALHTYGQRMAAELPDLSGYIFMQRSPSCGLERVKVYQPNGNPADQGGRGLYAAAFCAAHPDLPVEEDGRLNDPVLRENFLTRVYVYAAWQTLLGEGLSRHALTEFHARYKYLLMANNPLQYKALGQLLGSMGDEGIDALGSRYFSLLMVALKKCATRGTHSNVLQHLSGYFKKSLNSEDKREVQHLIDQYRLGVIPLVVPLTLLKHHLRRHPDAYLQRQAYLQPHPENLSLRNAL